jgi:class 3 adenylate cyclase/predicted ATPase
MTDLQQWLRAIGLDQYAPVFADNGVDGEVLADLTEQDLEKLGIPVGHRKKLLKAAVAFRTEARNSASMKLTARSDHKAERRYITVLFCDIVGSTALSTQLDPEDLQTILREYQHCCEAAIDRFGGFVARFMGDGVMAYFGFPGAYEDQAERAVNAAIQILNGISDQTNPISHPLEVRVGLATGLVVVGDLIGEGPAKEFALAGQAPNLAARLQQLAGPDQILIDPQTRRSLGKGFELKDLGTHKFKGFDDKIDVFEVIKPNPKTTRFEAHHAVGLIPLIGRERELALLEECFGKAERGEGQVVTISGEPGIGKSRLVVGLRDRVSGEAFCPSPLQCSSYHTSSPLYPIARYLENIADIDFDSPPDGRFERLVALVQQHLPDEGEKLVPLFAELLSIPAEDRYTPLQLTPQQRKDRTFIAFIKLLQAQSHGNPVVLVFEDVHWADPTTWDLLRWIQEHVESWRMLVVVLFRAGFSPPWNPDFSVKSMIIERLEGDQVTSLIKSLVDETTFQSIPIKEIIEKTDGVPLFVEEMTKALIEAAPADEHRDNSGMIEVPHTLRASLMSRLDQIPSMKLVAQSAAALGREFSIDLLSAVSPLSKQDMSDGIDRLMAAGLLLPGDWSRGTYIFKHALVQDAAYDSMLRSDRRNLHAKIADTVCERFKEIAESAPELVAHHYTEAQNFEPAIAYWIKAGQQASKRSAFVETTRHLEMALKLLAMGPATLKRDEVELQLQHSLGSAYIAAKGFGAEETARSFKRALDLCANAADSPHTFAVLNGMFGVHLMRGEFERSRDVANTLLARALRQDDPTPKLMGHRALGMALFMVGDFADAASELRKAIDLYDPVLHGKLALVFSQDFKSTAQAYLALGSVILGDVDAGIENGEEAVAYADSLRHPHTICYVLPFLAGSYILAKRPQAAFRTAERAMALSAEYGFPLWSAGGLLLRGWARLELAQVEEGLSDIERSLKALDATGTLVYAQFARLLMAQAFAKTGDIGSASNYLEHVFGELGSGRWYGAEAHRLKGELFMADGDLEAAKAAFEKAISVAEHQGAQTWKARATESLASCLRYMARSSPTDASYTT